MSTTTPTAGDDPDEQWPARYDSVEQYLADKNETARALFAALRETVLTIGPDVAERVRTADVVWSRTHDFASAFAYIDHVDLAVALHRRVAHRRLRDAYPATWSTEVTTHRFTIATADDIDDDLRALLVESYETVGLTPA